MDDMMSMGGGDMSSMMSGSKLSSSSMVRPIANLSDRKIVLDPSKLFCSFWTIIWTGFGTIEGQGRNHLIFQPEFRLEFSKELHCCLQNIFKNRNSGWKNR